MHSVSYTANEPSCANTTYADSPELSPRKMLVQLSPRSPRSTGASQDSNNNNNNKPDQSSWQVVNPRNSRRRASSMSASTLKIPESKPYGFNTSSPRSPTHSSPRNIPTRSASPLNLPRSGSPHSGSPRSRARSRSPRTRSSSPIHNIKNSPKLSPSSSSPRHLVDSPGYSSESESTSPRIISKTKLSPSMTSGPSSPGSPEMSSWNLSPGRRDNAQRDKSLVSPSRSYIFTVPRYHHPIFDVV